MSIHSHNKIWLHLIWETTGKQKIILPESRKKISNLLYEYSRKKNIFMKINYVNADHVHALVDLPTNVNPEECIKLFKGGSSYYINKEGITKFKFSWGKGYGVFSVSPSQLNKVVSYIKNQKEHHRVKTFEEEFQLFLRSYGIAGGKNG